MINLSPTSTPEPPISIDTDSLLSRIAQLVLQSPEPELQHILQITVSEVRAFLQADRVKVYKFHNDGSGVVMAESVDRAVLPSLLGLNFPADDIPDYARHQFKVARMRSIVNVEKRQIGQSCRIAFAQQDSEFEDIRYRPVDRCHVEYLTAMGVQSSLVLPILQNDRLWGLFVSHHSQPRTISEEELRNVQMVVEQLSVAIAQANLLAAARDRVQRETTANCIATILHAFPAPDEQKALAQMVKALQGSGGRLYVNTAAFNWPAGSWPSSIEPEDIKLLAWGTQPKMPELAMYPNIENIEEYSSWERYFESGEQPFWAIADLYSTPQLRTIQAAFRSTAIRGMLVLPLRYGDRIVGYLSVFRDAIHTETLWAGKVDPDGRQALPRQSFEVWKQIQSDRTHPWTERDLELAKAIAIHFAAAIAQSEMNRQVQTLNANLERKVEERTAKLQQTTEALTQTVEELKQAQTQLIQTEKMSSLGQLVAGVAHEINNPVNFIYGNLIHTQEYVDQLLELLQLYQQHCGDIHPEIEQRAAQIEPEFLAEDLPKMMNSMKTGANRIREIVLSLLNFSHLDRSEINEVNLHDGIESTLSILQHRLKAQPIRVAGKEYNRPEIRVIKEYGDLPPIECYAGQLNQVFMNILSNAIDAFDPCTENNGWEALRDRQPILQIQTERLGTERVMVRISDNGSGIPDGVVQKIFDPFFTTKPIGKGTGLGLSISYQIISDKHGGFLKYSSQPGEGTEFWIEIPVRQSIGSSVNSSLSSKD